MICTMLQPPIISPNVISYTHLRLSTWSLYYADKNFSETDITIDSQYPMSTETLLNSKYSEKSSYH